MPYGRSGGLLPRRLTSRVPSSSVPTSPAGALRSGQVRGASASAPEPFGIRLGVHRHLRQRCAALQYHNTLSVRLFRNTYTRATPVTLIPSCFSRPTPRGSCTPGARLARLGRHDSGSRLVVGKCDLCLARPSRSMSYGRSGGFPPRRQSCGVRSSSVPTSPAWALRSRLARGASSSAPAPFGIRLGAPRHL